VATDESDGEREQVRRRASPELRDPNYNQLTIMSRSCASVRAHDAHRARIGIGRAPGFVNAALRSHYVTAGP